MGVLPAESTTRSSDVRAGSVGQADSCRSIQRKGRRADACDFAGRISAGGLWIIKGQRTKRMTRKISNTDLFPVFISGLVSVLKGHELDKGRPFTEQVVNRVQGPAPSSQF